MLSRLSVAVSRPWHWHWHWQSLMMQEDMNRAAECKKRRAVAKEIRFERRYNVLEVQCQ
jgi:hypothetical protein